MPRKRQANGGSKMPALMKYKRDGRFVCYMTKIGYNRRKKPDGTIDYPRAWQYLGDDLIEARKQAVALAEDWDKLAAQYKSDMEHFKCLKRAQAYGEADPEAATADMEEPEYPHWPTEEEKEKRERFRAVSVMTYGPPKGEPPTAGVTIEQAETKYLHAFKARIGLQNVRGVKPGTYAMAEKCLRIALRGNGKGKDKPIDLQKDISRITRADVERLVNYWWSKERGLSERTAANYLRFFKQFIAWLDAQEIGFHKPKMDDLFAFRSPKAKIEKFDPDAVKSLLRGGTERCQLFQLLALNCGFYSVDIANLAHDEIVELNGEMHICRRRDKTSHQNDFTTLWWLFPEVATLLKKHLAPRNKVGADGKRLAFLNNRGRGLKNGKTDNIRDSFEEARENAKVFHISFKQFRKFGVSAIKRITMNPEIARMYAAQKVQGVLGCYDRDDFFDPLTEALKKWHAELKAAGIFDVKPEGRCFSDGKPRVGAVPSKQPPTLHQPT